MLESTVELKQYLAVLRKRLWLIVASVVVVTVATGIYSYLFTTQVYQASSRIIVDRSKQNELNLSEVNLNIQLANTYKDIILTYAVMDRVVEKHPELGLTSEQLMRTIKVGTSNDSQVMTLSAQNPSYDNAIKIVNAVTSVFKETIPSIMSSDNVSILSEAKFAYDVSSNPILSTVIGFIAALMVSVGAVFLLEYLDDTVKSEADVTQFLGVPTFATVAVMTRKDLKKRSNKQNLEEPPYATLNS
ncbi:Capsular polysaccharide type 8 biosynthesis protein cap8A [compost metagenome]